MSARGFRAAVPRAPAVRSLLYRYAGLRLFEAAQLLACNAMHPAAPRLARWLLMTSDRIGADQFRLTQACLASMLAVGRPYLNAAAQGLQRNGLIRYQRGQITLLDRSGLEAAACEDYRVLRSEYARLLSGRTG